MGDLRTTEEKVREFQKGLYLKAKLEPEFRFYALYDKLYRWDVLEEAWKNVRKNMGVGGVDKVEIVDIEEAGVEGALQRLREELKTKSYRPQALRRVYIPKQDGSKRSLSIPTIRDRVVQAALKIVLESIFEADFEENSYGFRPKHSAQQAAKEVKKYLNWGYEQVIETDIQDCFGTIPHKGLLEAVARRVVDRKVLWLIKLFLRAGVMGESKKDEADKGTPQGGVLSPLLANIYLDALDKGWKPLNKAARLIRYADDLVILTKYRAEVYQRRLERIVNNLKLTIKRTKTRVVNSREDGFNFLGYRFKKARSRSTGKVVAYCYPTGRAENTIRAKVRKIIDQRRPVKAKQMAEELTPVIRGWANYYRWTNAGKSFSEVKWYIEQRMRKFMRRHRGKSGYGYKEYSREYLYNIVGLYNDYHLSWTNALR